LGVIEPIVIVIIEPSRQTYWRSSPKHRFQHTPVSIPELDVVRGPHHGFKCSGGNVPP